MGCRVVKEIQQRGGQAAFAKTDVAKEADWVNVLEIAKKSFGGLDILVNNAGWTYRRKDTLTVTEQEYDRTPFRPLTYTPLIASSRCFRYQR